MSASVYEKSGAEQVYLVAQNKTHANLVADKAPGLFGIATDAGAQAWVFFDDIGGEHKCFTEDTAVHTLPAPTLATPVIIYFGPSTSDGSLRMKVTTTGFFFEIRVGGAWVTQLQTS